MSNSVHDFVVIVSFSSIQFSSSKTFSPPYRSLFQTNVEVTIIVFITPYSSKLSGNSGNTSIFVQTNMVKPPLSSRLSPSLSLISVPWCTYALVITKHAASDRLRSPLVQIVFWLQNNFDFVCKKPWNYFFRRFGSQNRVGRTTGKSLFPKEALD